MSCPAFLVAHPRGVRVRELVDQRQLGPARNHRVGVHLGELERPVLGSQPGNELEPFRQCRRSGRS